MSGRHPAPRSVRRGRRARPRTPGHSSPGRSGPARSSAARWRIQGPPGSRSLRRPVTGRRHRRGSRFHGAAPRRIRRRPRPDSLHTGSRRRRRRFRTGRRPPETRWCHCPPSSRVHRRWHRSSIRSGDSPCRWPQSSARHGWVPRFATRGFRRPWLRAMPETGRRPPAATRGRRRRVRRPSGQGPRCAGGAADRAPGRSEQWNGA